MKVRKLVRSGSLAWFVLSGHALAAEPGTTTAGDKAAQSKPGDVKPAGDRPGDVKPADVTLEEATPTRGTTPGESATTPSDEADQDAEAEAGADAEPKRKSRALEFIEARRNAAKESDGEAVGADEPSPERFERDEAPDDGLLGTHQSHFFLGIGPRVGFIADEGLDPFSSTDAFAQVAIFGGSTLFTDGDLSLAVVLEWDYGEREARARGLEANLGVHRVSLGAEGRYHVLRRLYGYVRLAPGALYTWAELNQLETDVWAFSADASVGAAFELFGAKAGETNKPRGWVSLHGGYGFGTEADLTLSAAKDSNSPQRTASLELDALSMSGPFVGGAVSLSY